MDTTTNSPYKLLQIIEEIKCQIGHAVLYQPMQKLNSLRYPVCQNFDICRWKFQACQVGFFCVPSFALRVLAGNKGIPFNIQGKHFWSDLFKVCLSVIKTLFPSVDLKKKHDFLKICILCFELAILGTILNTYSHI